MPATAHPPRRRPLAALGLALTLAGTGAALAPHADAASPTAMTERASVADDGSEIPGDSFTQTISADGRYVAFATESPLDPKDSDTLYDVYVRDRLLKTTTLVSVATNGDKANSSSGDPSLSADGRTIAFVSEASNLLDGNDDGITDTNGRLDVFVRHLHTGVTVLVSAAGTDAGDNASFRPAISADGRYVAFGSDASDLAAEDNPNITDVFRRDLASDEIVLVSAAQDGGVVTEGGSHGHSISADGQVVAYHSWSVLVPEDQNDNSDVYIRDLTGTPETGRAPSGEDSSEPSYHPSLSGDGRYVAYESYSDSLLGFGEDTNDSPDIFVYDRQTTEVTRVNLDADGGEAAGTSRRPFISADGQWVFFQTSAGDIVPGAADWLVRRPREGAAPAVVVSVTESGEPFAPGDEDSPAISADGASVAFDATHPFTVDDNNGKSDIFVRSELPTVTAVTPASVSPGTDPILTVSGSWFTATPTIDLGTGLTVKDVVRVSASELAVTAAVDPTAALGPRVVTVTNPAGHQGSCGTCLSVTGPPGEGPASPDGEDDTVPVPPGVGDDKSDVPGGGSGPGKRGGNDGGTRQEQGHQPELPRTGGSPLTQVATGLALTATGGVLSAVARSRASH